MTLPNRFVALVVASSFLIVSPPQRLFAQEGGEEPDAPSADGSDLTPTGVSGMFGGSITTGGSYDPFTRNFRREIDDIVVPGTIGAYPLKITRTFNSQDSKNWPRDLLPSGPLGNSMGQYWRHSYSMSVGGAQWGTLLNPHSVEGFVFPDGRVIPHDPPCVQFPPPIEENWEGDPAIWTMADGGRVHLGGHGWGYTGSGDYDYVWGSSTDKIVDPHGLETTISYASCTNCNKQNRIWRVTEPGGKYLEFTYYPEESPTLALIERIDAYDRDHNPLGLWAVYHYETHDGRKYLNQVDYSDGTQAIYHWKPKGNAYFMDKADDPHYAGPMRHIEYQTDNSQPNNLVAGEYKQWISSESNSTLVSKVTGGNPRTETRGDGATRTFTYKPGDIDFCDMGEEVTPMPGRFHGFLTDFTDFSGKSTHIDYYEDDDTKGRYRFVKAVTDAKGNKTEYIRGTNQNESWEITKIIYHPPEHAGSSCEGDSNPCGDPFIEQSFTDTANPYYLASRKALRSPGDTAHTTSYTRDTNHRVTRIDYPDSAFETFTYNAKGQVLTHRLKNGAYEHFEYDSYWRLTKKWNPTPNASPTANDPKTSSTYYEVDDAVSGNAWRDRVKTETDPRGNVTTYEYDREFDFTIPDGLTKPNGAAKAGRGLVTKIVHPGNKTQSFRYNQFGDKISETNELGKTTSYTYDDYGRMLSSTDTLQHAETFIYQKPNTASPYLHTSKSVFTHTSRAGIVTKNEYDDNWRKTSTTLGYGSTNPPAATTWFHYDAVGNLDYVTDPRGAEGVFTSYTTRTEYDFMNRPWRVTDALGRQTTSFYDSRGRVWKIKRADDSEETKTFDAMNRVLTHTVPKSGTPTNVTESITTTFEYYPSNQLSAGLLWKVTDGKNNTTTFQYDASGQKTSMTYPAASPGATPDTQTWAYDANHNLAARKAAGGAVQTFAHDNRNRKTAMRWSNSADFGDFGYDDAGRLTFAQNPYSTIVRGYDDAGRMTLDQQTMPGAAPTPVPLVDRPTVVSRRTHGGAGDFDIALPLTGDPGIETRNGGVYKIVATFAHTVTVNPASVSSGIGNVTATNSSNIEGGGTVVTIDLANVSTAQKLTVMLPVQDGQISDNIAIPMQILVGDANVNGVVNSSDAAAIPSHYGEVVTATNFRFDLNANGAINSSDRGVALSNSGNGIVSPPAGTMLEVRYGHDDDGKVNHLWIQGSGYDYTQTYDDLGRLEQIYTTNSSSEHFDYSYDKASNVLSRVTQVNLSNTEYSRSIDFTPDAVNRITALKINVPNQPIPTGGSSRNWFTREVYGYDAMNRLTSVQRDEEPNMSDQFGYYLNGELVSADYGLHWVSNQWINPIRTVDYTLDKAGNRTGTAGVTADGTPFNYQPNGLNQYTTAHSGVVGNGANHEITSYEGKNYAYVNDTRLAQVSYTDVSGIHLYQLGYDALGRCVRRTTGGSSTIYYIYDGERPIYEFDSGGGTPSTNVYGRGIDEIIARSNNGAGQYPMQDRLGSVILVTGGDGTILESYRYDAFGAPTMKKPDGTVVTTGASLINNRFLFTGREYAAQYGFYEYRARAYHPAIGRFMSEDPNTFVRRAGLDKPMADASDSKAPEAGTKATEEWSFLTHPDEAEWNLFRYCNNDPVNFTDPTGEIAPAAVAALAVLKVIAVNAAIGAGVDLAAQLYRNNGDLSKTNLGELKAAAFSGAVGGGIGKIATNVVKSAGLTGYPAIAARLGINAGGSGAVGATNQAADNVAEGRPPLEGTVGAFAQSAAWGGAGSLVTDGIASFGKSVPLQGAATVMGSVVSNAETPVNYVEQKALSE